MLLNDPRLDPRRDAYVEEEARLRRQRDPARSELMRKMDDDGSGVARRRTPFMVTASLVVIAAALIIVLVLAGTVHV
jgi:hypothetical protein